MSAVGLYPCAQGRPGAINGGELHTSKTQPISRINRIGQTALLLACWFLSSAPAFAHGFGQRFTLPLPFWLYGGGACVALLLSFIVLLVFKPVARRNQITSADSSSQTAFDTAPQALGMKDKALQPAPSAKPRLLQLVWMTTNTGLMALAIFSGWFGSQHAASNFSMTWFWIIFLLGFFYIAAIARSANPLLNPWWCAGMLCQRLKVRLGFHSTSTASNAGLAMLSAWPAFTGYLLLIELELFGHASPHRLSVFLLGYTALWILVAATVGQRIWNAQFDTFAALFDHISRLWPTRSATTDHTLIKRTHPWLEPIHTSAQLLICAMLASTAFDALRESVPWATSLWQILLTLFPQNTTNPLSILAALSETYRHAEMLVWLLMPFVYFALMAVMVCLSRRFAPVTHSFSYDMGLAATALLPLVLGYHVAHYFPLLLSEGPNIVHLLSDPLGEGWNLLGTANLWRAPILLETDTVWHLQVALIVLGHLGGVLVSHWQACQVHDTQQAVLRSQLPMLLWMMALTTWGLWILSQPMKVG